MIIIKSDSEIEMMRVPAKLTAEIMRDLEGFIKPGISTHDIDKFVEACGEITLENCVGIFF